MKPSLAIVIGIAVFAGLLVLRASLKHIAPVPQAQSRSADTPVTPMNGVATPAPVSISPGSSANSAPSARVQKQSTLNASPLKSGQSGGQQAKKNTPFIVPDPSKPLERQALSLVGADPAAETYWINSINDPNLSAHDRSDLIEDLNEEGFENPHLPTFDDLPMIENRLALIESLAPNSMDEVNAAAFAEAYKDLVNMRTRVTGK